MTRNHDLKTIIRTRMGKTDQSYADARRCVLAGKGRVEEDNAHPSPFCGDVRLWVEQGSGQCNLPEIVHKGPADAGFVCWGYGGSGPQDLALSILASYFPGSEVSLYYGKSCSRVAMVFHLEFLEDFLVGMPPEGGLIKEIEVRVWMDNEMSRCEPRPAPPPMAKPKTPTLEEITGKHGPLWEIE